MKRSTKWILWIIVAVVIIGIGWLSFGRGSASKSKTVTIGVITPSKQENAVWNTVKKTAKDKYGITINLKEFTDYSQPNKALASHNIDLNSFQTVGFLDQSNDANHQTLTRIGDTIITPMRLYSDKYKKPSQIPAGSTIAVPNDTANEDRGIRLLASAGLIKLDPKIRFTTPKAITSNPKHLKIKAVDANSTARALPDVAASSINGGFAKNAGVPLSKTIFTEPLTSYSKQYVNVIVANKKDVNNKIYKQVVKAYQTAENKKQIEKQFGQLERPAWTIDWSKISD
ncbi:MetQ/NlpA family ABC transporter substrate-binding protein [Secundilactobacillus kimchicus]|uniref:Lipoprotein n=1 Tax=Secundilactobacillus kimchicus JCM 15530 TaxID=1302272 RepID=A0A0R1HNE4_9LACO|nr:MetQ/NlpA family ABC transporter substrate-binding protein [Secundilactobacillus kimchicus]KRK48341.1 hypothetical protein FC96_GL001441 [Secundilactobacillus kimchicus JCM 15530]